MRGNLGRGRGQIMFCEWTHISRTGLSKPLSIQGYNLSEQTFIFYFVIEEAFKESKNKGQRDLCSWFTPLFVWLWTNVPASQVSSCEEYDIDSDFGKRELSSFRLNSKPLINRIKAALGPVCVCVTALMFPKEVGHSCTVLDLHLSIRCSCHRSKSFELHSFVPVLTGKIGLFKYSRNKSFRKLLYFLPK